MVVRKSVAAFALFSCVLCAISVNAQIDTAQREARLAPIGPWSCDGTVGKTRNPTGKYYVTSFGCWIDKNGKERRDPSDNCIPWCQAHSSQHGTQDLYKELCSGKSGPECERSVQWYAADADRFGCMSRLRVTNEKNRKSVIVVVLDQGPHCRIERKIDHWVLDLSYPASYFLFGEPKAATERSEVKVEPVGNDTPLGPVQEQSGN